MSRTVKGPDGILHIFPDDATDEEIGQALQPKPFNGPRLVPGSERTRVDTNIIGVDHNQIVQGIADWASKLPPRWQRPAAMLATFPADALASLVEIFSAPESVAAGGIRPTSAALDAAAEPAGTALAATGRGVEKVSGVLQRPATYIGGYQILHGDPKGAVTIAAPMIGKSAGAAMQRAGVKLAGAGGAKAATLSAAEEAELVKAGYTPSTIARIKASLTQEPQTITPSPMAPAEASLAGPSVPAPAPATPAVTPSRTGPPAGTAMSKLWAAMEQAGVRLPAKDMDTAARAIAQGQDAGEVVQTLMRLRNMNQPSAFAGLPSDAEVAARVAERNRTGAWPR